jgi:hypothetical protein
MSLPDPRKTPMNAVRVETPVEADGELHLRRLPCRRGDKEEAIVLVQRVVVSARPRRGALTQFQLGIFSEVFHEL